MSEIPVSQLRELQSRLNQCIDSYVTAAESSTQDGETEKQKGGALMSMSQVVALLTRQLQNPFMEIFELGFRPIINAAARIAIDLDLFNLIEDSTSLDTLVQKTGAERQLLFRVIRLLVSVGFFNEPQEKVYSSTPISKTFQLPPLRDWIKTCNFDVRDQVQRLMAISFDSVVPIVMESPKFIRENGFRDVTSLTSNPTMSLHNGQQFFDWLSQNPSLEADFASSMKIQEFVPEETNPQYPFDLSSPEVLKDPNAVYVVDVGGGQGQVLEKLAKKFPKMPGHNVLQDLPSVVAGVSKETQEEANFRAMPHDFFSPQPVIGAKYYVFRVVLHDWPDETCVEILKNTRTAMKKGYSKVLVYDRVLDEMGCETLDLMADLAMWCNCGRERTEREHKEMFEKAGLRLSRIVKPEIGNRCAIEGVRDDDDQ